MFCLALRQRRPKTKRLPTTIEKSFLLFENGISFLNGIIHEDNLFTIRCLLSDSSNSMHKTNGCTERRYAVIRFMTSEKGPEMHFGYYCTRRSGEGKSISFSNRDIQLDRKLYIAFGKHGRRQAPRSPRPTFMQNRGGSLKNVFRNPLSPLSTGAILNHGSRVVGSNGCRIRLRLAEDSRS